MVRTLILATAVSLCLSNHCAADAVRKVHVVDPVEAKKQEAEKKRQAWNREMEKLKSARLLFAQRHATWLELRNESNPETRKRLRLQLDDLGRQIQKLQDARKALPK